MLRPTNPLGLATGKTESYNADGSRMKADPDAEEKMRGATLTLLEEVSGRERACVGGSDASACCAYACCAYACCACASCACAC